MKINCVRKEISQIEKDHWKNYLKNHKKEFRELIFHFSPQILCNIFHIGRKQSDDELYILLRLHLSQQVALDYFENIYGMDERKAFDESLSIGKTMMETFADEFLDVFNEWGVHYNLKSKCVFLK